MGGNPIEGEPAQLLKAPKYRAWKKAVEKSGCVIRKVELLAEMKKPDGSLLFAMLKTRVEDPEGRPLPSYALIRGQAVLIVTDVVNRETGEHKFLMLRQRRIGHGGETLEFPAGMVDEEVDDPVGVALKELKEETGLDASRGQMFPLAERALYSSSGLHDEAIWYYGCELTLPSETFHALEGGETGEANENEYIRLGLWDYDKALPEVDSIQVRLGFNLWFDHKRRMAAKT